MTHSVILARRVSLIAPLAVPFITTHYLAWFLLNRIRTGEYALHTATIEKVDRPEFCRHSVAALRVAPFKLYR